MAKAASKLRVVGLRALRERAGLSRMDLVRALRVSVDPQTIYRLETGRSKDTSLETAKAIAEALSKELGEDITVYDLFPEDQGR